MSDALLAVEHLTKRFGGLTAVKDVSFAIRPGEILGLIGPNGSGKSTVMKAVLGVERPDGGSVKIAGTASRGSASAWCSSSRGLCIVRPCSRTSCSDCCRTG